MISRTRRPPIIRFTVQHSAWCSRCKTVMGAGTTAKQRKGGNRYWHAAPCRPPLRIERPTAIRPTPIYDAHERFADAITVGATSVNGSVQ